MTNRTLSIGILGLTAALTAACGGDGATPQDPAPISQDACSGKVKIGLYGDDRCTPGSEVLTMEMDIARECFTWSRSTGTGTRDNSATRFQCYRDRLCYTQYVSSATCGGSRGGTDKESRDTCMKDDTPNIWTRILGGTEDCPAAPAGFSCPVSEPTQGTPGTHAACAG